MVQDPKSRDAVEKLFDSARQHGAREGRPEDLPGRGMYAKATGSCSLGELARLRKAHVVLAAAQSPCLCATQARALARLSPGGLGRCRGKRPGPTATQRSPPKPILTHR
eukprot:scaffold1541_cov418-Prasinococcus_capsulatus_cf.AAC.16